MLCNNKSSNKQQQQHKFNISNNKNSHDGRTEGTEAKFYHFYFFHLFPFFPSFFIIMHRSSFGFSRQSTTCTLSTAATATPSA
jgi:hypothetical protein